MPTTANLNTIRQVNFPLREGDVTLCIPFPVATASFDKIMEILELMRPAFVRENLKLRFNIYSRDHIDEPDTP